MELAGGGGGGADSTPSPLERRVSKLEEKVERVEAISVRLEPKITELLLTGAKSSELNKLQVDLAEVKGRISSLPNWWMLMVAVLTTWAAGIVFTLVKAIRP